MAPALGTAASRVLEERRKSKPVTEHGFAEVIGLRRTPNSHRVEYLRRLVDVVCAILTTSLVLIFFSQAKSRHMFGILGNGVLDWKTSLQSAILYPILIAICCHQQRLYRRFPNVGIIEDIHGIVRAVSLATLLLLAGFFLFKTQNFSRVSLVAIAAANMTTLLSWRIVVRRWYGSRVAAGKAGVNVLIIGAGRRGLSLAAYLRAHRHLGYLVKGFLDGDHLQVPGVLGRVDDLARIAREQYADEIFITIPARDELATKAILTARKSCLDVTVVPELFDGLGFQTPLEYVGEFPVMELHREPIPTAGLVAKRLMDVFFGTIALVLCVPVIAILALLVYIDSPGPIFYAAQRVGKKGRMFCFYKMRSMVANADSLREELEEFNERDGMLFKMEKDPRVTSMGRFLRKYSLDELPQLWNVLKGDMSLVGPRPPLVGEYTRYRLEHKRRLDVMPGITGLWQVSNRHDPSFEAYLAQDLKYIENWNFWLDIEILLRTLPAVIKGTGY